MTRIQDARDARAAADEWATAHGLPESGGYSGNWYVNGYMGSLWPDGWRQWWADYSQPAGSIIGGSMVAHQYTSTPIDTDVMMESEIVSVIPTPPDDPCASVTAQRDGLVNSLGYIAGDLLAPVAAQKSGTKAVQRLVAGIRAQAEQQGINHV